MERITLTRKLNAGIYREDRTANDGVVATFPATKRGILKAARVYNETRSTDRARWGDIGAGRLTLTHAGRDITEDAVMAEAAYPEVKSILDSLLTDLQ